MSKLDESIRELERLITKHCKPVANNPIELEFCAKTYITS